MTGSQLVKISEMLNYPEQDEEVILLPRPEVITKSLKNISERLSSFLADIIQGRRVTRIHYQQDKEKIDNILELIEAQRE